MRLPEPLLRLPIAFDVETLAAEVNALPTTAWTPHPDNIPGNAAVRLITPGGEMTEGTQGRMGPTPYLHACPYVMSVLGAIGAVWGRTRLMRLAPGASVPPHVDTNFYWRKHVRIHVPIVTNSDVVFTCDGRSAHMGAGECWVFDTFSRHGVVNGGTAARVHLVADTVGDERLWDLIDRADIGIGDKNNSLGQTISPQRQGRTTQLQFERGEPANVMSPWELKYHIGFIAERARPAPALAKVMARLERFSAAWTGTWAQSSTDKDALASFGQHIVALDCDLVQIATGGDIQLRNGLPLYRQVAELLFTMNASLEAARGEQPY